MSNYLTPSAYQAYSKLLASLRTFSLRRVLMDPDNADLVGTLINVKELKAFVEAAKEAEELEKIREQTRALMKRIERILQDAREHDNNINNEKDEAIMQQRRSNDMVTSPGLEQVDSCNANERTASDLSIAISTIQKVVKAESAHKSLYEIMLQCYTEESIRKINVENLWMLDIHIGNACRDFVAANRKEVIDFLEPPKNVPGNDF